MREMLSAVLRSSAISEMYRLSPKRLKMYRVKWFRRIDFASWIISKKQNNIMYGGRFSDFELILHLKRIKSIS